MARAIKKFAVDDHIGQTRDTTGQRCATRKLLTIDRADVIAAQLPVLHSRLSVPRYRPWHVSILCSRRNTRPHRRERAKCTNVDDDQRYQRNTGCRRDAPTGSDRRPIRRSMQRRRDRDAGSSSFPLLPRVPLSISTVKFSRLSKLPFSIRSIITLWVKI